MTEFAHRLAQRDSAALYDRRWSDLQEMKVHGPASRWLRVLIRSMLSHVEEQTVSRILDLGCGQGTTTFFLARHFAHAKVVGIDFSQTAVACAQTHYAADNLRFEMDPSSRGIEASQPDLITCFEVLEHVDDWQGLLSRMANASRRYLLLSFPTGRMRSFESRVGHLRNFKVGEVEALMQTMRYAVVDRYYAGFPFYSPLYREICNLVNSADSTLAQGTYTWRQKLISHCIFFLFHRLSSRRRGGDQFVGLFEKRTPEPAERVPIGDFRQQQGEPDGS